MPEIKAEDPTPGERIAKRISRAGICSRRDAEQLIADGRVKVDGKVIDTPAIKVTDANKIHIDDELVQEKEEPRMWLYNKPRGVVTTNHDPEGRQTLFDILPPNLPRVITIGRLDMNSEGLLLLTNDGEIARHMELPSTGYTRRYRIRVHGVPSAETIKSLKRGLEIDGIQYGSVTTEINNVTASNCWLTVGLQEGKKRELRVLFEHVGHPVSRLIRISYGPFQLGNLEEGEAKEVPRGVLKSQLGKKFFE